ncbi:Protein N-acetyltransferase, RimJ/RimL family [Loktanella fryxellensis]|uniref:Protein N-acetyltransferase, RimJ/RimL family n=1 Tax=Loktanella fryxellensis TaxID=245187 RepID=A0A1H8CYF6_9RHOB|nr:GNAT family N-acetyltransferase [Loktanella fryxellensis]SEM99398.1 Protein N-acetyltransferase, RimJ/RimL family [Loktanella fryxellensis]
MTTLQTSRLTLRHPDAGDWGAFRDFMMSDRAAQFTQNGDLGRAWRSFAAELGHWDIFGYGMWAVTLRGDRTALGLIGPWTPPDWPEPEIGWMIFDPATEGTGIATEAARASLTYAFNALGWTTAVSYIHPDNARSIALAERLGAVRDASATRPAAYPDSAVWRHAAPHTA